MRQQRDTRSRPYQLRRAKRALGLAAIVSISAATGTLCGWLAPGLDRYARDLLMRARGPIAAPDDIVIVAVDESSIARLGRFPWHRSLTAKVIDEIAAAQPKVIALDILYIEPTTDADDAALADSIGRSGLTVVAAQIVESTNRQGEFRVEWLRPLAPIERRAAGVGHINVSTESDGVSRELPLRKADDTGQSLWSMAVEAIRIGDRLTNGEVQDIPAGVRLGRRTLPVSGDEEQGSNFVAQVADSRVVQLRSKPMLIDYIGPTGSFAPRSYSFAEVLDGKVPAEEFHGKYVLVGATAAALGDHVASPFVHREDTTGHQHGTLMPGVEVLANAVNTILRGRFYRETPDRVSLLINALIGAVVFIALTLSQGRLEALKQVGSLIGLILIILALCYLVFIRSFLFFPIVPALVSLVTAAPLTLLLRSLTTSADLDERIAELSLINKSLVSSCEVFEQRELRSDPAALIARLADASAVAIFARERPTSNAYKIVAAEGTPAIVSLSKEELLRAAPLAIQIDSTTRVEPEAKETQRFSELSSGGSDQAHLYELSRTVTLRLGDVAAPSGALVITYRNKKEADKEVLRLCRELAASHVRRIAINESGPDVEGVLLRSPGGWRLPRGVEWKTSALALLQRRMMARARFVDRALRSVEDGLIIAEVDGRILFANPRATEIFGVTERALVGSDLFSRIAGHGNHDPDGLNERAIREILVRLVVERLPVETEIVIGEAPPRYYTLRLSAVTEEEEEAGGVPGLVASLSDITKQHELQQTKNDVMALVTHELRTPLTAIQGMSEILAEHEIEPKRRRQMQLAINEEAKRLARLINDYLDIARLESGARPLRLTPAVVGPLIERALLMLDPLAAERKMRIKRRFAPNLPPVLVDTDLLAQAVTNLVANAIKYSSPGDEVLVSVRAYEDFLSIEVADQGHGIPAEAIPRIFEKFCRLPRVEDAGVSGTGLGLSFVREIAEKHGGRITVESEVGVGSAFSLRLPLARKDKLSHLD